MPSEKDIVTEARAILNASNAYTLRIQVRELLDALAGEVERLRGNRPRIKEAMLDEVLECDKCDLCEDHHANT